MHLAIIPLTLASLAPAPATARTNVLLITVDDLRPALGVMGDPFAHTPNLDALARRGTTFANHHVQVAECSPSRVSMMTGLRPDHLRVFSNEASFRVRNPKVATLPGFLRAQGWNTVAVGKVFDNEAFGVASESRAIEVCRGDVPRTLDTAHLCSFDLYITVNAARAGRCTCPNVVPNVYPGPGSVGPYGQPLVWGEGQANYVEEQAVDNCVANTVIAQLKRLSKRSEPFFLAVGFLRPHLPWSVPYEWFERFPDSNLQEMATTTARNGLDDKFFRIQSQAHSMYDSQEIKDYIGGQYDHPELQVDPSRRVRAYYASVAHMDHEVGRVLQALDSSSAARSTLIVLWGDNGFHLGPAVWGKKTNFEEATRTPLIIVPPGAAGSSGRPPRVSFAPVESVDVMPTVLDYLGVSLRKLPPASSDYLAGSSLRGLVSNPDSSSSPLKVAAMSQYHSWIRAWRRMGYSLRTETHRLIVYYMFDSRCWSPKKPCTMRRERAGDAKIELYEIGKAGYGAHETVNVAKNPAHAETLKSLLHILDTRTPTMASLRKQTAVGRRRRQLGPALATCRGAKTFPECVKRGCQWKRGAYFSVACNPRGSDDQEESAAPTPSPAGGPTPRPVPTPRPAPTYISSLPPGCVDEDMPTSRPSRPTPTIPTSSPEPIPFNCRGQSTKSTCEANACTWKRVGWRGFACVAGGY